MYCVKCGVELREGTKKCPLCETTVYFPEMKEMPPIYPDNPPPVERVSRRGLLFILTFAFVIAGSISLIGDINLGDGISWSIYVLGALVLAYVAFVLPSWFRHPNPTVFIPCDFAALALYLLVIDLHIGGGWFLPFALPITAFVAVIVCAVVTLTHYLRRGYLYIWGGASIAVAMLSIFVEFMIKVNFSGQTRMFWSFYPCAAFGLIGIMLLVIAIVKPFKESLCKIFSI